MYAYLSLLKPSGNRKESDKYVSHSTTRLLCRPNYNFYLMHGY
jgi:hypothetical protein